MESLSAENNRLQASIRRHENAPNKWNYYATDTQDAVSMFEQKLKGVQAATKTLTQEKSKEEMENTVQLW